MSQPVEQGRLVVTLRASDRCRQRRQIAFGVRQFTRSGMCGRQAEQSSQTIGLDLQQALDQAT